jgi:type I restriction enzyme, R subunit
MDLKKAQLTVISRIINAANSDVYDVLAYTAFALAPIARSERVEAGRGEIFSHYEETKLQAFLDFVLGQYAKQGVGELRRPCRTSPRGRMP